MFGFDVSRNTSFDKHFLMNATICGRNMHEDYKICSVTNSHIFIYNCRFILTMNDQCFVMNYLKYLLFTVRVKPPKIQCNSNFEVPNCYKQWRRVQNPFCNTSVTSQQTYTRIVHAFLTDTALIMVSYNIYLQDSLYIHIYIYIYVNFVKFVGHT